MPNRNPVQVTSMRRAAAQQWGVLLARRASAVLVPCLCAVLTSPARASDTATFGAEATAVLQEENGAGASSAYEVNSLVLPSLGDTNAGAFSQRAGGASTFAHATQHTDVTRWLTPQAPRSLGFTLGVTSAAPSASALANSNYLSAPAAPTSLDLGVRWRSRLDSGRQLDVSAWAQTPSFAQSPDAMGLIWQQQQQPVYGTRVEMQWASSRTRGLVPEFGAIGVQLQGGSRLVLRARKGGPMLYYRAKF
jgi:hypothetical protein